MIEFLPMQVYPFSSKHQAFGCCNEVKMWLFQTFLLDLLLLTYLFSHVHVFSATLIKLTLFHPEWPKLDGILAILSTDAFEWYR